MKIDDKVKHLESFNELCERINEMELHEKALIQIYEEAKELDSSELSSIVSDIEELRLSKMRLLLSKGKIIEAIALLGNAVESKLLRLHYMENVPWKSIAVELSCHEGTIYVLRRRAIEHLNINIP